MEDKTVFTARRSEATLSEGCQCSVLSIYIHRPGKHRSSISVKASVSSSSSSVLQLSKNFWAHLQILFFLIMRPASKKVPNTFYDISMHGHLFFGQYVYLVFFFNFLHKTCPCKMYKWNIWLERIHTGLHILLNKLTCNNLCNPPEAVLRIQNNKTFGKLKNKKKFARKSIRPPSSKNWKFYTEKWKTIIVFVCCGLLFYSAAELFEKFRNSDQSFDAGVPFLSNKNPFDSCHCKRKLSPPRTSDSLLWKIITVNN